MHLSTKLSTFLFQHVDKLFHPKRETPIFATERQILLFNSEQSPILSAL